jgi:dipeptidyl-peptidase-4
MRYFTLAFVAMAVVVNAQTPITIEDLTSRNTFAQRSVSGINWMNDGKYYTTLADNKIVKYDVTTGQAVETIFDGSQSTPAIEVQDYSLAGDEKKLLLVTDAESIYRRSFKASYYVYDLAVKSLKKLSAQGKQSYATFSPDANRVAFVRDNNLYLVNLATGAETAITTDGQRNSIINGSTDWVYEEELSFAQAFYWSPDGKKIAYYRFDESQVREYNMQKWNQGALYPEDYRYKYPKAGEANSRVEIFIHDVASGQKVKASVGSEDDIYIPRVMWTAQPNILSIRVMNRLQNAIRLLHTDANTGASQEIMMESRPTYFDIDYTDELLYLKDGNRFIFSSERSGYKHFYLHHVPSSTTTPITQGDWEATQLIGFDEKANVLFYLSTEGNYQNRSFYSIRIDGTKKTKLSKEDGTHQVNMSPDCQFYLDYFHLASQPLTVSLYKTKGFQLVKMLETNEALRTKLAQYGIVPKEFFRYTSADGATPLDGYLLKPKNMDPGKKYPVMVFQYSGPRSNNTLNTFGGGANFFWHQMLVQKGVVVAVMDTRGTGSRGENFAKQTYKQLGKMEMEDLVAGGRYLAALPFVDGARLGIWGWSYGGYTTSLVMTKGAGTYKLGIAGAPVTTWRYYDNIYTERFLQRPQDNPAGYDDNSPLTHAAKLQGHFLLIHGTGDDNVHFQNSVALEEALINAGKQFRSHFYPDQAHGFRGARVNHHRWTLMTEFILDNL